MLHLLQWEPTKWLDIIWVTWIKPVLLVGLAAGVAFGQLGYTHCCIEDVSIISSIPGIDIYSPIDAGLINIVLEEILEK